VRTAGCIPVEAAGTWAGCIFSRRKCSSSTRIGASPSSPIPSRNESHRGGILAWSRELVEKYRSGFRRIHISLAVKNGPYGPSRGPLNGPRLVGVISRERKTDADQPCAIFSFPFLLLLSSARPDSIMHRWISRYVSLPRDMAHLLALAYLHRRRFICSDRPVCSAQK